MAYLLDCPQPLAVYYDALLLDLDGVCYRGKSAIDHAPASLEKAVAGGTELRFITNNSARPPAVVAAHLNEIGIAAKEEQVINSALTTAEQIRAHYAPGSKLYVIGGLGVREALQDAGYELVDSAADDPVAVVQGLSETASWVELSEAVLAIKAGAKHFATNLDATLPRERGEMIGNGSLVAAVTNATGSEPIVSGKPNSFMYEYAVRKISARRPLAVGDRLDTDIIGANRAGYASLHVLTGVSSVRDIMQATPLERPSFLGIDLQDLHMPMPKVEKKATTWECAGHSAEVKAGNLEIDGVIYHAENSPVINLEQYRAATCAVWDYIDNISADKQIALPDFHVQRSA
ncbi:HAD-IIA family hydrolase [Arcanobacterium urinimassiliense]|uniref:HAD-IIA family hydrolase n=1 Tax=Arcanobacterium urinimassiliense TaxID=1871014 RepID=UPI00093D391A|nr:HAD-IIA family hydrolase [Arcanobacterium urinimassiliense]